MAQFSLTVFALLVTVLASLTMGLIIAEIAPAIAAKRDKKTLDLLLTTRLTGAEIVLGILVARLIRCTAWVAGTAPVVVLVLVMGGVDPWLALLAGGCLVSWGVSLAALAMTVSVISQSATRAFSLASTLTLLWVGLPMVVCLLLPRLWPVVARLVAPAALWLLDSSPIAAVAHLTGLIRRAPFVDAMLRMMALQLAGAVVLIVWAIWQLRPASRALADGEARSRVLRALRARWRRRPACGDDPILWYEIHSTHGISRFERVIGNVLRVVSIGLFAAFVVLFAAPAFHELAEFGYSAAGHHRAMPEHNPLVRVIASRASRLGNTLERGFARLEFNMILRQSSAVISLIYVMVLAGRAAETIVAERERDTWLGVTATPLTGREILRAKMLGAVWQIRDCVATLLVLWIVGVLAGALHPLGFLAALVSLGASIAFFAAWGVSASLWARDRAQAINRAFVFALLISLAGVSILLPLPAIFRCTLTAGSVPFLIWSALLSYEDVAAMFHYGIFPQLAWLSGPLAANATQVLATWLLGTAAFIAGASVVVRAAFRGFDAAVDRPRAVCQRDRIAHFLRRPRTRALPEAARFPGEAALQPLYRDPEMVSAD
jgi:hypothetical protein